MSATNGLYRLLHKPTSVLGAVLLALVLVTPAATAQEQRVYFVEVVIFENLSEARNANSGSLYFPTNNGAMSLSGNKAASLGFSAQEGPYTLDPAAQKIRDSGRYRMLKHLAWSQPGLDNKSAKAIRINLGKTMAVYIPEDIGAYKKFIPASAQPEPNSARKITTTTINGSLKLRLGRFLHLDTQLVFTDTENSVSYRMSQSRKMRSNEFHYIDNKRFGLLVKIRPIETVSN